MSKWIETIDGEFLNSSHICHLWVNRPDKFSIMATIDLGESYTIKTFENRVQAWDALELLMDELEKWDE